MSMTGPTKGKRTKQPKQTVQINRNNPLGKSAVFAFYGSGVNPVNGAIAATTGNAIYVPSGRGKSLKTDGGGGYFAAAPDTRFYDIKQQFTVAWFGVPSAVAAYGKFICIPWVEATHTAPYESIEVRRHATAATLTLAFAETSAAQSTANSALTYALNAENRIIATRSGASGLMFRNGSFETLTFSANDVTFPAARNRVFLNKRNADGTGNEDVEGTVYFAAVFNRAFTNAEVLSLHNNPWQIFEPRKRPIYVNTIASGVVESDANSAGVATVSGVSGATSGSVGASIGTGTASGVSGATAGSVGASTGTGTASGVGAAIVASVASSAGISTASADTSGDIVESTASSAGTSNATGVSGAIQGSVGASSGSSTAEGVGADGSAADTTDNHDGWLQPVKRRKQSKAVRRELERLFKKAEVVVEKIAAPKPVQKTVPQAKTVDIGLPPLGELQMVLMHMQLIQDQMTEQQMQRMTGLQAQIQRMYNIRARAALLAA